MTTFLTADDSAVPFSVEALRTWARDWREDHMVALVYGGVSAEDRLYIEKSPLDQLSHTALSNTLADLGIRHATLDPCRPGFIRTLTGYDVVLSNLHGPFGEDGRLQGLLDYLRMPYCGSGVSACAIAADKITCKRMMESLDVPTPPWSPADTFEWAGRPVMVKPATGGSSVGMSLVRTPGLLPGAIADAEAMGDAVLVEDWMPGLPVTVGMIELPGDKVLVFPPLATEATGTDLYDADAKLDTDATGTTVRVTQARLSEATHAALLAHARTLWTGIGLRGAARIDFIVPEEGQPTALEINTTPGMSAESNYAVGAGLCGLTHADIVTAWLHEAMNRRPYDVPLPVPNFAGSSRTRTGA